MRISDWSADVCSSDLMLVSAEDEETPCFASNDNARRGTQPLASDFALACKPSPAVQGWASPRSEEHTSELQSLMRISYAVFCLKKKTKKYKICTHKKTSYHSR